jgi:serine/threonine-protein kinase
MPSIPPGSAGGAAPPEEPRPIARSAGLPPHLAEWELPPDWRWGGAGIADEHRTYQEVVDALGRSLSLVTAPDPSHASWLNAEARHLGHRSHPSIPTTYHYWTRYAGSRRGPGYLRRWIAGEPVGARVRRAGAVELPYALKVLRAAGSTLAYLHDSGLPHGALTPENVWVTPTGRIWILGWQWAVARSEIPPGLVPDPERTPWAPEWRLDGWTPTPASDQWLLAATCFMALTGELPPANDVPPIQLVRPECPQGVAAALDRALSDDPGARHRSIGTLLRSIERSSAARSVFVSGSVVAARPIHDSDESRLRWAVGDDYDVIAMLGRGTFGTVWRVRDLSLEREVALKMLHPHVASDESAVDRFRREARLAAQLAHPAIVPIYDWDSRGDVSWYTMELAEGGSVAELIARSGARSLTEVAPQIDTLLDALVAAHSIGVMHRDLKPENILIDRYRRWRITDFGIAKVTGEDKSGATGTPAFAAPEQLLGEPQGPAVDCFAVAAIAVYVLTARPPFAGDDGPSILAQQLSGKLDLEGFEEPLAAWLRRGLAIDPDARFGDAAEMQRAWRDAVRAMEQLEARDRRGWWERWVSGE